MNFPPKIIQIKMFICQRSLENLKEEEKNHLLKMALGFWNFYD